MRISPAEVELIREAREALRSGSAVAVRETSGLSVPELAALISVDAATVWRWETGQNAPKGARAVRYALALRRLGDKNRGGMRPGRMYDHAFTVRRHGELWRSVSFYARSRPEARALAERWARHSEHEIQAELEANPTKGGREESPAPEGELS